MKKKAIFLFSILVLTSRSQLTGEEIARLPINKISTSYDEKVENEVVLKLKKDEEISFWSEMNIEYSDEAFFEFRLVIYKEDELYAVLLIDPTDKNITIGEVKTTIGAKTKWSFTGKNVELKMEEDGNYTFKVVLKST
jgi:hypothetical protein